MQYEIPKEWLEFCQFREVSPEHKFYFYGNNQLDVIVIPISEIKPPVRDFGELPFKKYKMVPVLMALINPEGELPPINVSQLVGDNVFNFTVENGFHRFYASSLAGFSHIPAIVNTG